MATKPDADPKITRRQAENARAAIKVGGLLKRLQDFVDFDPANMKDGDKIVTMQPAQVNAAKTLLAKVLPDMTQVETLTDDKVRSVAELRNDLIEMLKADPSLMAEALEQMEKSPEQPKAEPGKASPAIH